MTAAAFDPKASYRFFNAAYGSNYTLSLGLPGTTPSTPMLAEADAYSSENWQFFLDAGVYFIRNYDWGAAYRLGITDQNSSVVMLHSNGSLGMQWSLFHWDDSSNSTWRLTNGMSGFGNQLFLGVSVEAAWSDEDVMPAMSAFKPRAQWVLDINVAPGNITDSSMLTLFKSVQTASSLIASTTTKSTHSTLVTKSAQPSSHAGASSSSIAPGAIAGITIGVVAVVAAVLLFLWISVRRGRRRDRSAARGHLEIPSYSGDSEPKSEMVGSAPLVSELYVPPSELFAISRDDHDTVTNRVKRMTPEEMPADSSFSGVSNGKTT